MNSIDVAVAWWGAVLGTAALLWDIAKWRRDGPRLRTRVKINTTYLDSRVLSTRQLPEGGECRDLAEYCHIEVVNVGTLPTTIIGIAATHSDPRGEGRMSVTSQRFTPHYGRVLPSMLGPGEVWSCRLEMTDLHRLRERGDPYIEVHVSHRQRPLQVRQKLS